MEQEEKRSGRPKKTAGQVRKPRPIYLLDSEWTTLQKIVADAGHMSPGLYLSNLLKLKS